MGRSFPCRLQSTSSGCCDGCPVTRPRRSGGDGGSAPSMHSRSRVTATGEPISDPIAVGRSICLQLLDRRALTRSELASAMDKRGIPAESAKAVLDRLVDVGLVDDVALASSFAVARHQQRGLSRRSVAMQLRRRGIDDEVVEMALTDIDTSSEFTAASKLVSSRMPRMSALDPVTRTRRLMALLARRGYSGELAATVVREALAGDGEQSIGCQSDGFVDI
jgi:regulatory protein